MFVIPPYLHALAWLAAVRPLNAVLGLARLPQLPAYGWAACWWAETMAFVPVVLGLTSLGLARIDPGMIDAARLIKPDHRILGQIVLPFIRPSLVAGAAIVFLLSLLETGVPLLFHANVYPLEILAEFNATGEPSGALFLSLPLLVLAAFLLWRCLTPLARTAFSGASGPGRSAGPDYPVWLKTAAFVAAGGLGFHLAAVFGTMLARTAGLAALVSEIRSSGGELLFTLWTSAAAALIAALLAAPSAGLLLGRAFPSRFLWLAIAAAMAVPAPLAGAGLSVLVGVPGLSFLGSGATAVIMASLIRFLPFAVLIQAVQLRRVDRALVEAARVFERRVLKSRLRIDARLRAPGLWAAAGIVFSLSAGELAATLVVVPPGRETLAVKIFNYLHYGAAESVAGLCLVLAAATLGFGLLSARSLGRAGGGRVPAGSDPGGARR